MDLMLFTDGDVQRQGRFKKSKFYEERQRGEWPDPVSIGARAKRYPAHEIHLVLQAAVAGATTEQRRELVGKLHAMRRELLEPEEVIERGKAFIAECVRSNGSQRPSAA